VEVRKLAKLACALCRAREIANLQAQAEGLPVSRESFAQIFTLRSGSDAP